MNLFKKIYKKIIYKKTIQKLSNIRTKARDHYRHNTQIKKFIILQILFILYIFLYAVYIPGYDYEIQKFRLK